MAECFLVGLVGVNVVWLEFRSGGAEYEEGESQELQCGFGLGDQVVLQELLGEGEPDLFEDGRAEDELDGGGDDVVGVLLLLR